MNDSPLRPYRRCLHARRRARPRLLAQDARGSVYWNCCDRVSRACLERRGRFGHGLTLSTYGIDAFTRPGLDTSKGLMRVPPRGGR
jgi:hypothetical protein